MDDADVVAFTTLTDQYLKRFGSFIENHFCTLVRSVSEDGQRGNKNVSGLTSSGEFSSSDVNPPGPESSSSVTLHTASNVIWDVLHHPIKLRWTPIPESASFEELTGIPHPIHGNPDVQKVMLVLVTITSQARSLREKGTATFINSIVLYGDGLDSDSGQNETMSLAETEGEGHVSISKLLPLLFQLLEFIQECTDFVVHWVSQVAALFKESKPHVVAIANLQLYTVFREFGDLLGFLVVLDEVVRNQVVLQEHWLKYRQMIKSVRADSRSFDAEAANLVQLEKDLIHIDKYILASTIFKNFIDSVVQSSHRFFSKNALLAEKFRTFLSTLVLNLEKDSMSETDEYKPISLAATYVFASFLFPSFFDTRRTFQKTLSEHLRRIQAVPIPGCSIWMPEVFLNNCVQANGSKLFDNRAMQSFSSNRQTFLQQKVANLAKDVFHWNIQFSAWTVKLQEVLYLKTPSVINMADLSRKCTLIIDGIKLAQTLSQNFKLILNLHASLARPVGKNVVVQLCQILEILKSIQNTFFQFNVRLSCSIMYIVQYVMHTALIHVRGAQKSILNSDVKKVDEIRADALSVLKIMEHCFRGTLSDKRLLVAQIGMDWACSSSRLWKDEDTSLILPASLDRITQLINIEKSVDHYCNGSAVYFHRVILSTYFSSLYLNPQESSKLPLIFLIIRDCVSFLRASPHCEQTERTFLAEIESYLKTQFIERLCQDVEIDLRLLSHTHLQIQTADNVSPFRNGMSELENILEIPMLSCNGQNNISFRSIVEHYISKTFYNLASVALHDWQSYSTMRVLAADKYKLQILDDHLPGHSLEQGRDILEIVRNLPQFVAEFSYNLNNQVFIQINSYNKHLDTVNIRHLANSLRAHGPGMANTTIDFTYRFLRSKIQSLSKFLYDEQIKSRLSKDIRLFKQSYQNASSSGPKNLTYASFLFDRAVKFKLGIRKLYAMSDGLSPLDHFRILITHIGNALGFVRLVRSGGSHFLAGGYQFVPDLQDINQFNEILKENSEMEDTIWTDDINKATLDIDSAIKTLSNSFSDGIDYFKLLVNAFQPALLDPSNIHLKNFFGIIPALTLSYVDHMRLSKEKLAKRSIASLVFTDDGFPMGVAYLLRVLNQGADFDSLSWFSNVEQYLLHERHGAVRVIQDSKKDEKLQQANTLTAKRLLDDIHEFQLVSYNLSSARIFFHNDNASTTSGD